MLAVAENARKHGAVSIDRIMQIFGGIIPCEIFAPISFSRKFGDEVTLEVVDELDVCDVHTAVSVFAAWRWDRRLHSFDDSSVPLFQDVVTVKLAIRSRFAP